MGLALNNHPNLGQDHDPIRCTNCFPGPGAASDESFPDEEAANADKPGKGKGFSVEDVGREIDQDFALSEKLKRDAPSVIDTISAKQPGDEPPMEFSYWDDDPHAGNWWNITKNSPQIALMALPTEIIAAEQETDQLASRVDEIAHLLKDIGGTSPGTFQSETRYEIEVPTMENSSTLKISARIIDAKHSASTIAIYDENNRHLLKNGLTTQRPVQLWISKTSLHVEFPSENFRLPLNRPNNPRNWGYHRVAQYIDEEVIPAMKAHKQATKTRANSKKVGK